MHLCMALRLTVRSHFSPIALHRPETPGGSDMRSDKQLCQIGGGPCKKKVKPKSTTHARLQHKVGTMHGGPNKSQNNAGPWAPAVEQPSLVPFA